MVALSNARQFYTRKEESAELSGLIFHPLKSLMSKVIWPFLPVVDLGEGCRGVGAEVWVHPWLVNRGALGGGGGCKKVLLDSLLSPTGILKIYLSSQPQIT